MARCRCWCFGVAAGSSVPLLVARSCHGSLVPLLSRFIYRWLGPDADVSVLQPVARSHCMCLGHRADGSVALLVSPSRCSWLVSAASSAMCCWCLGPAAGVSVSLQLARCAAGYSIPPSLGRPAGSSSVLLRVVRYHCWWLCSVAGGLVLMLVARSRLGRSPGSSGPMLVADHAVWLCPAYRKLCPAAGGLMPLLMHRYRCRWLGPAAGSSALSWGLGPAVSITIPPWVARSQCWWCGAAAYYSVTLLVSRSACW